MTRTLSKGKIINVPDTPTPAGLRDRVLFTIGFQAGLRRLKTAHPDSAGHEAVFSAAPALGPGSIIALEPEQNGHSLWRRWPGAYPSLPLMSFTRPSVWNFLTSAGMSALMAGVIMMTFPAFGEEAKRPRLREAGLIIGTLPPGPLNGISDVDGVRVGHTTVIDGETIRTGVTAIFPHGGNLFQDRVPAAIHVGNGFGKLLGFTQVQELGELETPLLLTNTLSVWRAADALSIWMLEQPGMENVRSINPVVGETNDGWLNDIRARAITPEHVFHALNSATTGPVVEGAAGAGTGTVAFGWKGGIGTSSRQLPGDDGAYTVGVLVQSNFGGDLTLGGIPLGRLLRTGPVTEKKGAASARLQDGSIMIVVATDAPLGARSLSRLASRALVGLSRTGSNLANGSGDYVIAFSTHPSVRRVPGVAVHEFKEVTNEKQTPLFQAVAEATEEAIGNSLFAAVSSGGRNKNIKSLPLDMVLPLIQKRK